MCLKSQTGVSPLFAASLHGYKDIVNMLITTGRASVDKATHVRKSYDP